MGENTASGATPENDNLPFDLRGRAANRTILGYAVLPGPGAPAPEPQLEPPAPTGRAAEPTPAPAIVTAAPALAAPALPSSAESPVVAPPSRSRRGSRVWMGLGVAAACAVGTVGLARMAGWTPGGQTALRVDLDSARPTPAAWGTKNAATATVSLPASGKQPESSRPQAPATQGSLADTPTQPQPAAPFPTVATIGAGSCVLEVESTPQGAAIMVDGKLAGTTPATVRGLWCGREADVLAVYEGYEPRRLATTPVEGLANTLRMTLSRQRRFVQLTSTPSGATVTLNGDVVGLTPVVLELPSQGNAFAAVRMPGYLTEFRALATRPGERGRTHLTLTPSAGIPRGSASEGPAPH